MATQQTHRELAPKYAAGKVPVPWGRECHWETRRPLLWSRQRSFWWSCGSGVWSFAAAKLCHERLQERQLNGAHSFHALPVEIVLARLIEFSIQHVNSVFFIFLYVSLIVQLLNMLG